MNMMQPFYNPRDLQNDICQHMHIEWVKVFGVTKNFSRLPRIVQVRWVFMWIRHQDGVSLSQIGRELKMDHTSVKHAIDVIEENANKYSWYEGMRFSIKSLRQADYEFTVGSFIIGL